MSFHFINTEYIGQRPVDSTVCTWKCDKRFRMCFHKSIPDKIVLQPACPVAGKSKNKELSDYPAMSFIFVYWHIKIQLQISWVGWSTNKELPVQLFVDTFYVWWLCVTLLGRRMLFLSKLAGGGAGGPLQEHEVDFILGCDTSSISVIWLSS